MCDEASPSSGISGLGTYYGSRSPLKNSPSSSRRKGEINQVNGLSSSVGGLLRSDVFSDVTLIVEGERFPAHRVILACRSDYFRAMFFCGLKETTEPEVELRGTSVAAFKAILGYIYTGKLRLTDLDEQVVLDTLGLAHQYEFRELEVAIADYLQSSLSFETVCIIYDAASLYGQSKLKQTCLVFMDQNAPEVLGHESFLQLSEAGVKEILDRDSLFASEAEIFEAVRRWLTMNDVSEPKAIMSCVRLPLLSVNELLRVVRPAGLISADELLDAIQAKNENRKTNFRHRGYLVVEENVATPRYGAEVIMGETPQYLLDGDNDTYDLDKGFARHVISDPSSNGRMSGPIRSPLIAEAVQCIPMNNSFFLVPPISHSAAPSRFHIIPEPKSCGAIVVRLGRPSIINHLKLLLWDRDTRSYSYYIEGSVDEQSWEMLVDHSYALCRSWQEIYFSPRVIKYIRIVGTYNTANRLFHLVSLEAYFTNRPFTLRRGVIVPKHNVASTKLGAIVLDGVSRSRDALLNGDTKNYDWDSGYTCHQLGGTAIVVQLAQPYWINSMRLLLWDCDDRSYSYHIETSVNNKDWQMAVNKDRELCRSWQNIILEEPRPVVFIKIVGVHNTANEVFHCVHFECPSTEALAANFDDDEAEEGDDPHPDPRNPEKDDTNEPDSTQEDGATGGNESQNEPSLQENADEEEGDRRRNSFLRGMEAGRGLNGPSAFHRFITPDVTLRAEQNKRV